MIGAPLPPVLQIGTGVLIFATGAFLVASHALLNALAARSAPDNRATRAAPWLVGGYLAVWLALGLVTGDAANFAQPQPLTRLLLSVIVGFAPMFAAMAFLFRSRTLRTLNASMSPDWLIRLQAYRMLGIMLLVPFLAYGVVPAAFAWPAAVGDFATGLAAPFVASAVARRRPTALAWATAWNLFGILDLLVAPAAAILSNARVINHYPLALVPLFLGPPMGILTHVLSLRNLAITLGRRASRPTGVPSEALGTA
jgi:hypothetical protein